jgi:putative tributyrin esterase
MNLATLQFYSKALGKHVTYAAILPERGRGPYPVLMQLHGFSDDYSAWLNFSSLVDHVKPYEMIVVLPDGGTSFYLNLPGVHGWGQQRYEDFLVEDLYQQVNHNFHTRPGRWAIGGLSMGGYGSMRLGCKYPQRFCSIWAHSGVYFEVDELDQLPEAADANVYALADVLVGQPQRPVISFDCGVDDGLIASNRHLHRHLDAIGLPHTYREHPGAHTWGYWDEHVREALAQHDRVFAEEVSARKAARRARSKT